MQRPTAMAQRTVQRAGPLTGESEALHTSITIDVSVANLAECWCCDSCYFS